MGSEYSTGRSVENKINTFNWSSTVILSGLHVYIYIYIYIYIVLIYICVHHVRNQPFIYAGATIMIGYKNVIVHPDTVG